jgi:hypothetical protein
VASTVLDYMDEEDLEDHEDFLKKNHIMESMFTNPETAKGAVNTNRDGVRLARSGQIKQSLSKLYQTLPSDEEDEETL